MLGASGKLGSKIVEEILGRVPAAEIGVSVRDPARASDLKSRGVRVRQGDYSDPASLKHAWEGAKRVLLVSSNAAATGGNPLEQHANAIRVAQEIGVERVLYTSQISSSMNSLFPPGRDHAATEQMLAKSGLAWTALRHGFYADSVLMMNKRGFDVGRLEGPQDGKVAWVTHDDLAAADAAYLAGTEVVDGPTPPLIGNGVFDLANIAAIAAEILGRAIVRETTSETEVRKGAEKAGVPEGTIDVILGYYRAARAGEFAGVDATLTRILGRQTKSLPEFLREHL